MKKHTLILVSLTVLTVTSCIPTNQLLYMQDPVPAQNEYALKPRSESRIKPNDELYIKASSFDDVAFNFFGNQGTSANMGYGSESSVSMVTYSVGLDSTIYFPVVGKVKVVGLTLEEARTKMETLLKEYFNQPTVVMKFALKKISIIGEVRNPGSYSFSKEEFNILEALSLAGDLTLHGDRHKVYLIRAMNDKVVKTRIDLTKDQAVFGDNFYLQSEDILYVSPRGSSTWNTVYAPLSLLLSAVTTTILVINFVQSRP